MGFGEWGLGFGVRGVGGLGSGVWRNWDWGLGFRAGIRDWGLGTGV